MKVISILMFLLAQTFLYAQDTTTYVTGNISYGKVATGESGAKISTVFMNGKLATVNIIESNGAKTFFSVKGNKFHATWGCEDYQVLDAKGSQWFLGFCLDGKNEEGKNKMMLFFGKSCEDYSECMIFHDLKEVKN